MIYYITMKVGPRNLSCILYTLATWRGGLINVGAVYAVYVTLLYTCMISLDHEQICGTDRVTYESVCHLRSQLANAQVDYRGVCVNEDGSRPWELCRDIRNSRRLCEDTQETCKDGCCPICGMLMSTGYLLPPKY